MPRLTFLPMNQTFEAQEGESILDVAIENDILIQHACGGFCACTTCHVHVKEGAQFLSEIEEDEDERLERATNERAKESRLGCQARLKGGNVVVEILNLQ
jgi:2Fe-2S ferredoxin